MKPTPATLSSLNSRRNTKTTFLPSSTNAIAVSEPRRGGWKKHPRKTPKRQTLSVEPLLAYTLQGLNTGTCLQMREIAEIELAIQGGTEKIEAFGMFFTTLLWHTERLSLYRRTGEGRRVDEGNGSYRGTEEREGGEGGGPHRRGCARKLIRSHFPFSARSPTTHRYLGCFRSPKIARL